MTTSTTTAERPEARAPSASIRKATPADLPRIERLLAASGLPTAGVPAALPGFLVAEHEGELVGVIGVEECRSYGLLRSAAVDPTWRSRGLGRQLVDRAIGDADARGVETLYLLTTTAERYFPRFGFTVTTREAVPEPVRETLEFRGACPASATVMARPLSPTGGHGIPSDARR